MGKLHTCNMCQRKKHRDCLDPEEKKAQASDRAQASAFNSPCIGCKAHGCKPCFKHDVYFYPQDLPTTSDGFVKKWRDYISLLPVLVVNMMTHHIKNHEHKPRGKTIPVSHIMIGPMLKRDVMNRAFLRRMQGWCVP